MITVKPHYYICRSGKAKAMAEAYRAAFVRLGDRLKKAVDSVGGERFSYCDEMMLLRGVRFPNTVPTGWSKPNSNGLSRPLRLKANAEIRKFFTPDGSYFLERHPDLRAFFEWLKCPTHYAYTGPGDTSGSSCVGHPFHALGLAWYSSSGPIMLWTPDVADAKRYATEDGKIVKDNVLDWTPPAGLRRIMKEEWALMEAKYRVAHGGDSDEGDGS